MAVASGGGRRNVPFVDLKRFQSPIRGELYHAARSVIDECNYIQGQPVRDFEQALTQWIGGAPMVGVSCATAGLFALLRSIGVGPGDEVLTTVHTAIATSEAISLTGAQVVFCDIRADTYNIDPLEVQEKITAKTRAIIAVHLYGQPADMDKIADIASASRLFLLEDCAQAMGARHRGRYVGTIGDAGVFSFFPSKNLGGFGDGGAVTARDPGVAEKVAMFSNHGRKDKYLHEFEGTNSRLDTIQAAMLAVCLRHLDEWNRLRQQAAAWYDERLKDISEVTIPVVADHCEPVYHVYVIAVDERERLRTFLNDRGVKTGIHYPYSLNVLPAYAHLNLGKGHFPRAEEACRRVISLPMFPMIVEEEVDYVCRQVREFYRA